MQQGGDLDRIVLSGMEYHAHHGVYEEEEKLGARFSVDVELELPLTASDSIRETVDYGRVHTLVGRIMTQRRFKLIEALAATIAEELLRSERLVRRVVVRVHKPNAPLKGIVRDVHVEVRRSRAPRER